MEIGQCWSGDRLRPFPISVISVMYSCDKDYADLVDWKVNCKPLEKVGNYDLLQEDSRVFRRVAESYPREWPDVPLPTVQTAPAQPKAGTSTTPEKSDAEEAELKKKIQDLLSIHHSYVDVLRAMGVDPIKDYQEKQADTILQGVMAGDTRCKVCEKRCSSTQKLKNHIRKRHIGKTPYFCGECNWYYGIPRV